MSKESKILRVGIIGCGDVAQVVHIPTLSFSPYFKITYLCDVSPQVLSFAASRVSSQEPPKTTTSAAEVCSSPDVDLVFVLSIDEYHTEQVILALENDKLVFVEKPLALTLRDVDAIRVAERKSKGKVMVGYMRRWAAAFVDGVKEVGGIDKILYARVRDIIGPNPVFVDQSGTNPRRFTDYRPEDVADRQAREKDILTQALEKELGVPMTDKTKTMWRTLGSLGSHDISAMREVIGMPKKVTGAHLGQPFWTVLFEYPDFPVTYESGFHSIPKFDAHIEIYGQDKSVRIDFDTPFVKGLATTMYVMENVDGGLKETTFRRTFTDPYTLQLDEVYDWAVNGKEVKTTVEDARNDTVIFGMMVKAAFKSEA